MTYVDHFVWSKLNRIYIISFSLMVKHFLLIININCGLNSGSETLVSGMFLVSMSLYLSTVGLVVITCYIYKE